MSLAQWTPGTPARRLTTWDAQKREEKGQRTAADTLDSVARSLPALMRAEKIQDKARKAGFDWAEMGPALDKLSEEEMGELRQAVEQGANVEEELGDLLFAAVKVGRFAGLDSEQALHGACEKFIRRFRRVEELAGGRPLDSLGLHRLEELWQQAKQDERLKAETALSNIIQKTGAQAPKHALGGNHNE